MKPHEVSKVIALLKAAFPRQVIGADTIAIYSDMLADLDAQEALNAVKCILSNADFFPTIAEIRAQVARSQVSLPNAEEAWNEVRDAIRAVGIHREPPTFSHPAIQRAAEAIGWNTLCESENIGVERAHFMRFFHDSSEREMRKAQLGALLPESTPRRVITGEPVALSKLIPLLPEGDN